MYESHQNIIDRIVRRHQQSRMREARASFLREFCAVPFAVITPEWVVREPVVLIDEWCFCNTSALPPMPLLGDPYLQLVRERFLPLTLQERLLVAYAEQLDSEAVSYSISRYISDNWDRSLENLTRRYGPTMRDDVPFMMRASRYTYGPGPHEFLLQLF